MSRIPPDGSIEDHTARLVQQLTERVDLADLAAELSAALVREDSMDAVLQACVDATLRRARLSFCGIWTLAPGSDALVLAAWAGAEPPLALTPRIALGDGVIGRAAAERLPFTTNEWDSQAGSGYRDWGRRESIVAFAVHPLFVGDRLFGVQAALGRRPLSTAIQDALSAGATQIALGLERKRIGEHLRASEARYRELFEDALTGNYISTPEGRLLDCNPAFAQIFGFASCADALAAGMSGLHAAAGAREAFVGLVAERKRLDYHEYEGRRTDGTALHLVENVIGTFDDKGALVQLKGYVFDDTRRHRLESQLRQAHKMEAVGQLAGGIAHDFNNLLGVILGYAELLGRDVLHEGAARRVLEIRKAADRAAALTRQLLAFSRQQILEPRVLDLNGVVPEVEKMLHRLIGEDIQLVTVLGAQIGRVKADPGQLEQVLMNLAVNARDAMPDGGTLVIETTAVQLDAAYAAAHAGTAAGRYVMLAVSDSGHGMDAATQARIFEPFYTTKPEGRGTGLGLATVYGIVQQSGGFLNVYSEPGHGTTFKVYLPRVEAALSAEEEGVEAGPPPGGTETVLVVEDADALRVMVREILQAAGYHVLDCGDPEEGLAVFAASARPIHALITDVVMPRLSGPELARRARALRPEARVIFMSGYTNDAMGLRGILAPGTHFVQKPFTSHHLLRKVREVLDEAP